MNSSITRVDELKAHSIYIYVMIESGIHLPTYLVRSIKRMASKVLPASH